MRALRGCVFSQRAAHLHGVPPFSTRHAVVRCSGGGSALSLHLEIRVIRHEGLVVVRPLLQPDSPIFGIQVASRLWVCTCKCRLPYDLAAFCARVNWFLLLRLLFLPLGHFHLDSFAAWGGLRLTWRGLRLTAVGLSSWCSR